ncbi:aminotransferase class I/II-fold pyridoxal phosphate-dependent enzyme [Ktedonosporobacter rubrisoli]|uniref:Aminotransferase class I/II-fold pyridoxal phosphate-dependent enzyme n=1 Tax=Ktedonosporobacter rubrisoli TaxID=2509675 RepID=A0A4P6JIH6_KTERU|nr:aminotransferase class I/II-fold pyridoxal phosphate-dependent enzyme [Ktedonosporobacter rubrisoli]QBD74874.1 aminotransferase class I/II-fold pyridoxal phosphate-dependent enzyme [Ktedonosporobacter rubrisoli]
MGFGQLKQRLQQELDAFQQEGRFYSSALFSGMQGPRIVIQGRPYINLASNNYLGFAQDPRVIQAAAMALKQYGFGSGNGRLVATMEIQATLERRLATLKQCEAVLTFQTGYDTNLGTLSTLFGAEDVLISDAANHASIIDGCRFSAAQRRVYPHNDLTTLEKHLRDSQNARTICVVTDGVFSMDGDIAPLPEIVNLAEAYGAIVYVDDAHGDGVLGSQGRGIVEHFQLHGRVAIEVGTLSKAFGGVGGFLASDATITSYVFQRSRPFTFSTGHLPPMVAAGLLAALDLLEEEPQRLKRLWENTVYFRQRLKELGFQTGASATPIIPLLVGEAVTATAFVEQLRSEGIFAQAFSYPVVAQGAARIRMIISAAHSQEDLARALQACERVGKNLRLI